MIEPRAHIGKIKKPKSVSELVLERLRDDIIKNRFELGAKISEAQLSGLYGVTKAPIRSAYIRLEAEGLVEVRPQSGTYVFQPSIEEVRALCELRTALELEALHLAMERNQPALARDIAAICDEMHDALTHEDQERYQKLDSAFHTAIMTAADSPLLAETYKSRVNSRFSALRFRFSRDTAHNGTSLAEHLQLRDHIKAGRQNEALAMMRAHIAYTERYYQAMVPES